MKAGRTTRVIVVGAGPAGLTAAITLARQGVEVLVVDRRTARSTTPKAVGVGLRAMELLRSWGLEDAVRAAADDVELALLAVTRLVDAGSGRRHDINVPTVAQSAVASPTAPVRIAQDDLEHALLTALADLPNATVRHDVELVEHDQATDGVRAVLRDVGTDETRLEPGAYLVAADGSRSRVRHDLGIGFPGPEDAMVGVSAEFTAPLWALVGEHRFALYSVSNPEVDGVLIPAGGGRWQFGQVLAPGADVEDARSLPVLVKRIRAAVGVPDLDVTVGRVDTFRAGAQVATRFRDRRVLLVGDAAHRVTPRGGNGLAMAMRGGFAIGWRLAWVLRGWAHDGFLDNYEAELRPVVTYDVARAAEPVGHCHAVVTEMLLDLGGRLPHTWVEETATGPCSVLDLVGDGLTLFTANAHHEWAEGAAALGDGPAVSVVRLAGPTARGIGINPGRGALLVRPDGVPVASWWSTADAAADLRRALASLLDLGGPGAARTVIAGTSRRVGTQNHLGRAAR